MREPACLIRRGTSLDPAMNPASSAADKSVQRTNLLGLSSRPTGICAKDRKACRPRYPKAPGHHRRISPLISTASSSGRRTRPFRQIENLESDYVTVFLKYNLVFLKLELTIITTRRNIRNIMASIRHNRYQTRDDGHLAFLLNALECSRSECLNRNYRRVFRYLRAVG